MSKLAYDAPGETTCPGLYMCHDEAHVDSFSRSRRAQAPAALLGICKGPRSCVLAHRTIFTRPNQQDRETLRHVHVGARRALDQEHRPDRPGHSVLASRAAKGRGAAYRRALTMEGPRQGGGPQSCRGFRSTEFRRSDLSPIFRVTDLPVSFSHGHTGRFAYPLPKEEVPS